MKKKLLIALSAGVMACSLALTGCGNGQSEPAANTAQTEENSAAEEGNSYDMAGMIPATCFYTGKSMRFGYLELWEKSGRFWPEGERIRGHEFHYYDSTDNGTDVTAVKPVTGKEYPCMIETENRFMGFPHLYYPSNPAFAKAFVEKAERYKGEGI